MRSQDNAKNTMLCVYCMPWMLQCAWSAQMTDQMNMATHNLNGERTNGIVKRPHSRLDDPHEVNMVQWCCSRAWPDVLLHGCAAGREMKRTLDPAHALAHTLHTVTHSAHTHTEQWFKS
jgi:hypothetical protein